MVVALAIVAAVLGGGVAAVTGFGIGSLLTPALSLDLGIGLAVVLVAVPHFVATAARLSTLVRHVDRRMLLRFGVPSAAGGLAGALIHTFVSAPPLVIVFGLLLVASGVANVSGLAGRRAIGRWLAAAGALSGVLGGMVGNQGGIRSAALLGTGLGKTSLVATATATALLVDIARTPVYLVTQGRELLPHWPLVLGLCAAVVAGTIVGRGLLQRVPDTWFRRTVGAVILLLGIYMLCQGAAALT